ncbi:MAG TPA: hypothetical protein VIG63_00330 [Savagea sp.]
MILLMTVVVSLFFLFQINRMTYALCSAKDIEESKQPKVYRTVNTLLLILMLTYYVQVYYVI